MHLFSETTYPSSLKFEMREPEICGYGRKIAAWTFGRQKKSKTHRHLIEISNATQNALKSVQILPAVIASRKSRLSPTHRRAIVGVANEFNYVGRMKEQATVNIVVRGWGNVETTISCHRAASIFSPRLLIRST